MPATLDESNGNPTPNPKSASLRLGFLPATPDALLPSQLPTPSPPPDGESLTDPEAPAGSGSGDGWDDESYPESPDDTPSPASTPESDAEAVKVELFREEELQALARGGVAAAGEKAHDLFATTPGQQHVGLYLTDPTDQAQIGDPLASIAARHQGVAGKVNPDTKDLLSAMVGLFGYATKQINRRTEARALDAGAGRLAGDPQPVPEAVDL